MASGYKVLEPSGKATMVVTADKDQTWIRVQEMIEKWGGYCERNWLNDSDDMFSPEQKVKRFLDSIAYLLLIGHTQGIETDYKKVMHSKREIPASYCPSFIDNALYASGSATDLGDKEERAAFGVLMERLESNAEKYESKVTAKQTRRQRQCSKFQKYLRLGIQSGEWCRVDTDGIFQNNGRLYQIDKGEVQYQPVDTEFGKLYDMDRILATNTLEFYDMNYNPVKVHQL